VLGGLASSRLDNQLVRSEQTAVSVTSFVLPFQRVSLFEIQVDVKPGQDADAVSRRLDAIVADYIANGPTDDEVRRTIMRTLSGRIQGLEQVGGFGGKAVALAEGALYANNPGFYRTRLEQLVSVTPAQVRAAMQRWLTRPVYALRVDPGEREAYEEASGVSGNRAGGGSGQRPRYYRQPETGEQPLAPMPAASEPSHASLTYAPRQMPGVAAIADLDFPEIQRASLSNGIHVVYARRTAVPVTG
jgi:hypothetical protein